MPASIPRGILTFACTAALLFTLVSAPVALSQAPPVATPQASTPATPQKSADYSKEAFVVESLATHARFENDGTGRLETTARIRVQTDAGVQAFTQLVFPYNSATEHLEISYVRVRRAGGAVETAPAASVKDVVAPVVRDAPLYAGPREKHVAVPALHAGEALEYQSVEVIAQPLVPGQFWYEYPFERTAVTLEQALDLDVPAGRVLKIKARPGLDSPEPKEEAGRRIYHWSASHLPQAEDSAKKPPAKPSDETDVRVSTFSSWDEIAALYQSLERGPAGVTPEIQKKADELTQGRATPIEKLEALYDFAATTVRYVNLPFGSGHLEPHTPESILKNEYGDSIDKHTLLAALVAAAGLKADAVLIHTQRDIDPDFPSPAGVDHVLSRVKLGPKAEDPKADVEEVWLDTTTEVAPFRFLAAPLRHKRALAIPPEGAAAFVETPADPPFPVRQAWRMEGSISDLGKLDARVHYTLGGDNELLLRLAFRRTPKNKWKELGQAIAGADGLRGEVDGVTPSDVADTHQRFTLDYHIVQQDFLDWSRRRIDLSLPFPALALPEENAESWGAADTIELGSPA